MKKMIAMLAVVALASVLGAADMTLDGNFQKLDENKKPTEWKLVQWSGYKPDPVMEIVEGYKADVKGLRLSGGQGQHGFGLKNTTLFKGKAGQFVTISVRAKGTGWFCATIECKNDEKVTVFSSDRKHVKLTSEWKEYLFEAEIKDGAKGKATQFDIAINGAAKVDISLSGVAVMVEE